MADFISRGFRRRRRTPEDLAERLPPGQYYEPGFPVLTAGPTPRIAPADIWRDLTSFEACVRLAADRGASKPG